jgi:hypothetical protein
MTFSGSENQIIASTNSHAAPLARLNVNKPAGELQINSKVTIWVNLNLIKGHVAVDEAANLLIWSTGNTSGASDSSYVDGAISKYGTTAFTFPVGRNGHYKPLSISAPGMLSTFKARYANLDPSEEYAFTSKDTTINEISTNEYWQFERSSGSANVTVSLYRDNMGCSYDTLDNLKVTAYNGSTWKDLGNGGTSGNDSTGTISTNGVTSVFGMYTLATTDTFDCVPCRADAGEDKHILQFMSTIIGNQLSNEPIENIQEINWSPLIGLYKPNKLETRCSGYANTEYTLELINSKGCFSIDKTMVNITPRILEPHIYRCVIK